MHDESKAVAPQSVAEQTPSSELNFPYLSALSPLLRNLETNTENPLAQKLLNHLSVFAYDNNLMKARTFTSESGGVSSARGVKILTRAGLASALRENPDLQIVIVDIANLRAADQAKGVGNAADVLLTNLGEHYQRVFPRAVIARIGGDEFVLCFPQDVDFDTQSVASATSEVSGFFGENLEPAKAKYAKAVLPPQDSEQKAVFDYFLTRRGLPLTQEELEQITSVPDDKQLFAEFPTTVSKLVELERLHPELRDLFDLAKNYVATLDKNVAVGFQEELYKYIVEVVYHPLLRDKVGTVSDLEHELAHQSVREAWTFTVKIKEINDALGLAVGDEAIQKLFEAIKLAIKPEDRPHLRFYSQGGTIHVTLGEGGEISDETQEKLNAIVRINLNSQTFLIGNSHTNISQALEHTKVVFEPAEISPNVVRAVIEDAADSNWYEKVIAYMSTYLEAHPDFLSNEDTAAVLPFTFAEQIRLFLLNRKRQKERTATLFDIFQDMLHDYHDRGGNVRAFRRPSTAPLRRIDDEVAAD